MKITRSGIGIIEAVWLACIILVFIVSLAPADTSVNQAIEVRWSNVGHLSTYFVLSIFSAVCVATRYDVTLQRLLVTGAAVYGISLVIEGLQPLFGRNFSWFDLTLNAVGVLGAMMLFALASLVHDRRARRVLPGTVERVVSRVSAK